MAAQSLKIDHILYLLTLDPRRRIIRDGAVLVENGRISRVGKAAELQDARADRIIDAIGPETYSYRGLVQELARILGVRRPIVSVPAPLGYAAGWLLGKLLRDVLITRDEVEGLMQGLLATRSQPTGRTKLSSWAQEHATTLGRRYATELGRRKDRRVAYVNAK